MSKKKTKVWVVVGHNGEGKEMYNPTILGFYANEHTAQYRIDDLREEGAPYEVLSFVQFETGEHGVDLNILIR